MEENKTKRIAYWDNLKTILIFLVVLGHFLYQGKNNYGRNVDAILYFIYMFHMPAFVFTSGYFAKRYVKKDTPDAKKLVGFLVLYIALYTASWLGSVITKKEVTMLYIFSTNHVQWYLLCMFMWYLVLPLCCKLRPVSMGFLALLAGLVIGFDPKAGPLLSSSRFFVFFPFFLAGYYFDGTWIERIKPWMKWASIVIILVTMQNTYIFRDAITPNWSSILCGNKPYDFGYMSLFYRFMWYFGSFILVASVLCLSPDKELFFTFIGRRTIAIYMLHSFIIKVVVKIGLYNQLGSGFRLVFSCAALAVITTVVLSEKHLTDFFNKAFTSDYRFLLK